MVKAAGGKSNHADDGVIVIKKYANRRLYNTATSKYITLDCLAELTRKNQDFKVIDAKSGEDITHGVLTQIIMEEEASGEQLLPLSFLKQIIGMYDSSMRKMVPGYLERAMDDFQQNQKQIQTAFENAIHSNPLAELTKRNMEAFSSLAPDFMQSVPGFGGLKRQAKTEEAQTEQANAENVDLDDMKRQMAELQAKIDCLSKAS